MTTPYRYTGQRQEELLGLYYYQARWYDPALGRFVQADTVVPEPGNPQAYNRYAYGCGNPTRYVDPTGHFPILAIAALAVFAAVAIPGDSTVGVISDGAQNTAVADVALAVAFDPYDIATTLSRCFDGDCTAWDYLGMALPLVPALGKVDNLLDVRHAARKRAVQSILDGVDTRFFNSGSRFGRAFYVAVDGDTAVAEVIAHGGTADEVIHFQVDLSQASILDLTDTEIAKAWGYTSDLEASDVHRSIASEAITQGYNVIKYDSFRGSGYNLALLDNPMNPFLYDEWLIPVGVSPGP